MLDLRTIAKDHHDAGALHTLINVHAAVDPQTYLTKGGDLLVVLKVEAKDAECWDPGEIDGLTRQFENAIRTLDERFRIYQYLLKRDSPPIPHREYASPIVRGAVLNRIRHLESRSLSSVEIYFVVAHEGLSEYHANRQHLSDLISSPKQALHGMFSAQEAAASLGIALDRAREELRTRIDTLRAQLADTVKLTVLSRQEAYDFLRHLVNYAPHKVDGIALRQNASVDFQLCDSSLECFRDHLRLDQYYVQVLTLKEPPAGTRANMLQGLLSIPCQMILSTEWRRQSNARMRTLIQRKRRHFHNSKASVLSYLNSSNSPPKDMLIDTSASALVGQLGLCLEAMEVGGHTFGEFSLTAILYDEDHARLKRAVAECFKVFSSIDAAVIEERYNLLNAFLATIPGNRLFNLRRMWLLDTNYADFSFLFAPNTGQRQNTHLQDEYLAVLESEQGTPFFFNLHQGDVAHTLLVGASGSGKSYSLNFLLTHVQKYSPFTFVFDLGGSYEDLTRLFGGTYTPVAPEGRSFSINPFCLPLNKPNHQFLSSFGRVLIESAGYVMTAQDELDLYEQIENVYAVEPKQRRLRTLANILSRPLREQLKPWVEGGPYGAAFDNSEDNLTFARFQTFDFAGMANAPQILQPLLFYVLHRASAAIEDEEFSRTFKVFVMDEAWRFFKHPTIRAYIIQALKTWRKKNAAMILATQSGDDLVRSEVLSVVAESCPTKLFLANPGMDRQAYRELFHLNEVEAERIATLIPKQQVLLKTPELSKVVNLRVDPRGYWLYTSNPHDSQKKREAFARYGFEEGLEILARSNPS